MLKKMLLGTVVAAVAVSAALAPAVRADSIDLGNIAGRDPNVTDGSGNFCHQERCNPSW